MSDTILPAEREVPPTPHLIKLLELKALPYHKAGKHHRVRFFDLMRYKTERDQASTSAMEESSRQAQEFGMGYE